MDVLSSAQTRAFFFNRNSSRNITPKIIEFF